MRVRYWYTWKGHRKEYDELEEMAQNNAAERCEANGWYEIIKEDDESFER